MKIGIIDKNNSSYIWTQCSDCKESQKEKYFTLSTADLNPALVLCDDCFDKLGVQVSEIKK